jgi:hypothetical protein
MPSANEFPTTRAEAIRLGSKFYFTGKPCKHYGNLDIRLTSACKCWCSDCRADWSRKQVGVQKANKDKVNARNKKWRAKNPEKVRASKDARRAIGKIYVECPGKKRHRNLLRTALIKRATPAWADLEAIKKIYVEASVLRKQGSDVHVDHIIPLQGKTVCGLHVHWNLRIIPAIENMRKHNHLITTEREKTP